MNLCAEARRKLNRLTAPQKSFAVHTGSRTVSLTGRFDQNLDD